MVDEKKFRIADAIVSKEKRQAICTSEFITANDLCAKISVIFKQIFADFEGCKFVIPQGTNIPTVQFYFNHRDYSMVTDKAIAVTKTPIDSKVGGSKTMALVNGFQRKAIDGDRYFLTEEGKAVADLLYDRRIIPKAYNKDGNVNWGTVVSDVTDLGTVYYGNPVGQQYTAVLFIDPVKIIELITDDEEEKWCYAIRVVNSMPNANDNFMLEVRRVSEEETINLCRKFGVPTTQGLDIIR